MSIRAKQQWLERQGLYASKLRNDLLHEALRKTLTRIEGSVVRWEGVGRGTPYYMVDAQYAAC